MPQPTTDAEAAAALEQALDKAKEVAADLRQAADDLAVANTVFEAHLAQHTVHPEVDQALDHTEAVEKKVSKSADQLDEINATLDGVVPLGKPPS